MTYSNRKRTMTQNQKAGNAKKQKRKAQQKDPDRCDVRAFEVIYDFDGELPDQKAVCKLLCGKKHGLRYLFSVIHTEEGKSHLHVGLVLRDRPTTLKWSKLKEYFTVALLPPPRLHGPLKNKSKDFEKKLQTYYNYCIDEKQHVGQEIHTPYLHKYVPKSEEEQMKPTDHLTILIRKGLTLDELDELIDNPETSLPLFKEALSNHDKYLKMIEKLDEIRERKRQQLLYKEEAKLYRPFQAGLTKILDTQNDRNIHVHQDRGDTGKNFWLDREGMREDTVIMQSAATKRIAYMWNPRKHRRIIFDIPKGKMEFVNTSVIEKLKNGTLFSTMHYPKMKRSVFKPSIVILGNEMIENTWTEDRLTESTVDKSDYQLRMV